MDQKNYITPEGISRLKAEYNELMHVERPRVVETVAWAAGNGDRSENADYIYGKRRLREIDSRVRFLTDRIEKAEVVDPKSIKTDKVVFGATVTVLNSEDEPMSYQIVGEDESDLKNLKFLGSHPWLERYWEKRWVRKLRLKNPPEKVILLQLKKSFILNSIF